MDHSDVDSWFIWNKPDLETREIVNKLSELIQLFSVGMYYKNNRFYLPRDDKFESLVYEALERDSADLDDDEFERSYQRTLRYYRKLHSIINNRVYDQKIYVHYEGLQNVLEPIITYRDIILAFIELYRQIHPNFYFYKDIAETVNVTFMGLDDDLNAHILFY